MEDGKLDGLSIAQRTLKVRTPGRGLFEITSAVADLVASSGMRVGMCTVFLRHTSCSLVIQENADPSARADLEAWLERLAPEGDPAYTHTAEGRDDMPSHLRSAVTRTSEQIPIVDARLGLGTWQGLYLWEHRTSPHRRHVSVTVIGER
jgi:secondary thiamine-phosphate synthase enzyme